MIPRLVKSLALRVPYVRRVHDGMEAMRSHIEALERTLAERAPAPPPVAAANEIVHFVDAAWCDMDGVYLRGWVHAGPHAVKHITLRCGASRVTVEPAGFRVDVVQHYPHIPAEGAAVFEVYLACQPFARLEIEVTSDAGQASMAIDLPARRDPEGMDATLAVSGFMATMSERGGTVLELGARIVGSMTEGWRTRLEPACRYLGNDIHPGPGIDVVGDVHALTRHVPASSLDGIFSVAVLEHLAAPWIAAVEINRALRMGGETLHVTHQTWPMHETPNDFFRMSDQALRSLFGAANGFEVVDCGMAYPVSIVPPPHMRHLAWLAVPLGRGYGQSFIRARKVRELDGTAPSGAGDLAAISRAYPPPATLGSK